MRQRCPSPKAYPHTSQAGGRACAPALPVSQSLPAHIPSWRTGTCASTARLSKPIRTHPKLEDGHVRQHCPSPKAYPHTSQVGGWACAPALPVSQSPPDKHALTDGLVDRPTPAGAHICRKVGWACASALPVPQSPPDKHALTDGLVDRPTQASPLHARSGSTPDPSPPSPAAYPHFAAAHAPRHRARHTHRIRQHAHPARSTPLPTRENPR